MRNDGVTQSELSQQIPFLSSLKGKLILVFLLVGLVPLAVVGGINYWRASQSLRLAAGASLADLAFNASDKLDRNLFERYGDVQAYAKSDQARSMDPQRLTVWMNTMMQTYSPIYTLMAVANREGRIIAVNTIDLGGQGIPSQSLVGLDVSSHEWFKATVGGQLPEGTSHVEDMHEDPLVGRVYGTGNKSYAMSFSFPIVGADGKIVGVWTNRFNWKVTEDLLSAVLEHVRSNKSMTTSLTLLNREGRVLASDRPADTLVRQLGNFPVVQKAVTKGAGGWDEGESFDVPGKEMMFGFYHSTGYATYPGVNWGVVTIQERDEALAAVKDLLVKSLWVAAIFSVLIALIAFAIARAVTTPIMGMTNSLQRLATSEADLSQRLEVPGNDEVSLLSRNFNMFMANLESLIKQVLRSGILVTTSTTQISAGSKELEATVSEQVAATNEVVATAREISATSNELAKTMNEVSALSESTAESASLGQRDLLQMEQSMGRMEEASKAVSAKLGVINEKAGNISTVVTTITKVADQTNLLSLNAAIEAEKAGQYGQGFAVVAREIRRLADQTAVATLDIEKMVKEMKTAVSSGVMSMDKFADQVRQAVEAVKQVGLQLAQIIDQVQTVTPRFDSVHTGMQAQSQGAQQISDSMAQLSDTTQQTAQALRETNQSIESLNEAARGLQSMFARFRVGYD